MKGVAVGRGIRIGRGQMRFWACELKDARVEAHVPIGDAFVQHLEVFLPHIADYLDWFCFVRRASFLCRTSVGKRERGNGAWLRKLASGCRWRVFAYLAAREAADWDNHVGDLWVEDGMSAGEEWSIFENSMCTVTKESGP